MKKAKNKVYYDKKSDVLWFVIKSGQEDQVKEVAPGVNVELDKNGNLLGIEILNASKILGEKISKSKRSYSISTEITP